MAAAPPDGMAGDESGAGFRVTTGTLYVQIEGLKTEVASLKTDIALVNQSMVAMAAAVTSQVTRTEKLEGRFNGMLVGIGVGIATALVAVFRGVIA